MAASFWVTLAAGVGVLAASGHCMTARWAFAPVCGFDFWRVIVTSPEVLIFLFFMITDPKTVPAGRVDRVLFGVLVAVASTLLMAPQTNEFGTKVALLGRPRRHVRGASASSIACSRSRPPSTASAVRDRLATGSRAAGRRCRPRRADRRHVVVLGVGIVAAGSPPAASSCPRRPTSSAACRTRSTRRRSRRSPSSRTSPTGTTRSPDPVRRSSSSRSPRTSSWRPRRSYVQMRRSSTRSTTATGWTRCRRGSTRPRRPA